MRMQVRVTRRPSGCALTLVTFGALMLFVAIGDANPAAAVVLVVLAVAGGAAYLIAPIVAHRKHAELTPGCRVCRRMVENMQADRERLEKQMREAALFAQWNQERKRSI